MGSNQLVKQIIWWQEEDNNSLSIKKKVKDKHNEHRAMQRYYLIPEDKETYFTYREMEIAMHLFDPITYKAIGQMMGLSDRTVECHVRRMRIKLGCKDRFELIEQLMPMPVVIEFKDHYFQQAKCVPLVKKEMRDASNLDTE